MKKIKYIAPMLTLATMPASLIPITSCKKNKEDLGITREQWNNAWAEIKDATSTNRNFTLDGTLEVMDGDKDEFSVIAGDGKQAGKYNGASYDTKMYNNTVIWARDEDGKLGPCYIGIGKSNVAPMIAFFAAFGEIFDLSFDILEKVDNLQYKSKWLNILHTLNGNCYYTLDQNYHISKVVVDANLTIGSYDIPIAKATLNFSKYGDSTIPGDFDEKFTDVESKHIIKAVLDGSKTKFVATQTNHEVEQFNFIMPSDLALNNLDTIEVTRGAYIRTGALFLNTEQLIEGIDYVVEDKEHSMPKKIKLNSPLKANDQLIIIGGSGDSATDLIIELTHGE